MTPQICRWLRDANGKKRVRCDDVAYLEIEAAGRIVVHHHIGGYPPHLRPEEGGAAFVAPKLQLQALHVQD